MELANLTIRAAQALLQSGAVSSVELTQAYLARIATVDVHIQSYLTVTGELALAQAAQADAARRAGTAVGPLHGIPFALKDCFSTRGVRTTCASRILENYVPRYDATIVKHMQAAGAILLGKNNMDQFGMGSSCENSAFQNTHNPWDLTRVPGGSSGGSAAAVSAGLATFTIGEDTGGSIRAPASFCNVVGLKPTYGRVSRYGLIALASSFDSIGPFARDVYDCALVMEAIAGHDELDSTSLRAPVPAYSAALAAQNGRLDGVRIGVPREYFGGGMDAEVEATIRAGIAHLASLGAQIKEVSLPNSRYAIPTYYLILFAEASANLARFDGVRFGLSLPQDPDTILDTFLESRRAGFGDEVKRRILLGAYVLSAGYYDAYYLQAQKVRTLIRRDFEQAFAECDALVTPTSPTPAFKLGEKLGDPLQMYLSDIHVVAINPAGVPALAVPCGFAQGLPVGMQIIGPHLGEEMLFRIGHAYQQSTEWHMAAPPALTAVLETNEVAA